MIYSVTAVDSNKFNIIQEDNINILKLKNMFITRLQSKSNPNFHLLLFNCHCTFYEKEEQKVEGYGKILKTIKDYYWKLVKENLINHNNNNNNNNSDSKSNPMIIYPVILGDFNTDFEILLKAEKEKENKPQSNNNNNNDNQNENLTLIINSFRKYMISQPFLIELDPKSHNFSEQQPNRIDHILFPLELKDQILIIKSQSFVSGYYKSATKEGNLLQYTNVSCNLKNTRQSQSRNAIVNPRVYNKNLLARYASSIDSSSSSPSSSSSSINTSRELSGYLTDHFPVTAELNLVEVKNQ